MSSAFPFVIDRIALTANWSQRRARLTEYVLASTTFYGEKPFDILRLFFADAELRFPNHPAYSYEEVIKGQFPQEPRR